MPITVEDCASVATSELIHNVARYCRRDEAQILRGDIYISRFCRRRRYVVSTPPLRPRPVGAYCSPFVVSLNVSTSRSRRSCLLKLYFFVC